MPCNNSPLIEPVFLKLLSDVHCLGYFWDTPYSKGEIKKNKILEKFFHILFRSQM